MDRLVEPPYRSVRARADADRGAVTGRVHGWLELREGGTAAGADRVVGAARARVGVGVAVRIGIRVGLDRPGVRQVLVADGCARHRDDEGKGHGISVESESWRRGTTTARRSAAKRRSSGSAEARRPWKSTW